MYASEFCVPTRRAGVQMWDFQGTHTWNVSRIIGGQESWMAREGKYIITSRGPIFNLLSEKHQSTRNLIEIFT